MPEMIQEKRMNPHSFCGVHCFPSRTVCAEEEHVNIHNVEHAIIAVHTLSKVRITAVKRARMCSRREVISRKCEHNTLKLVCRLCVFFRCQRPLTVFFLVR